MRWRHGCTTTRIQPWFAEMDGILHAIAANKGHQKKLKGMFPAALDAIRLWKPDRTGELHRLMYDELSLAALLRSSGFREKWRVNYLESRIPAWASFGLDNNQDGSPHQPESVWMEAIK